MIEVLMVRIIIKKEPLEEKGVAEQSHFIKLQILTVSFGKFG